MTVAPSDVSPTEEGDAPRKRRGSKEKLVESMDPCVGLVVVATLVVIAVSSTCVIARFTMGVAGLEP